MTPPINIDGTNENYSSVTIDGQTVEQITIDGQDVLNTIPDSGVLRYDLENSNNDTLVTVDSWDGYDGSVSGASYNTTGGPDGNGSYTFDGTDDIIDYSDSISEINFDGSEPYTFAVQISVASGAQISTSRYDRVVRHGANHDVQVSSYSEYEASGQTQFKIWDGSTEHYANGTDIRGSGYVWLIAVYDPSNGMELYEDDTSQDTESFTGQPNSESSTNSLGDGDGSDYYEGDIADFRLYSKALTSTEVSNLVSSGSING